MVLTEQHRHPKQKKELNLFPKKEMELLRCHYRGEHCLCFPKGSLHHPIHHSPQKESEAVVRWSNEEEVHRPKSIFFDSRNECR
jgi:hypothetical protein